MNNKNNYKNNKENKSNKWINYKVKYLKWNRLKKHWKINNFHSNSSNNSLFKKIILRKILINHLYNKKIRKINSINKMVNLTINHLYNKKAQKINSIKKMVKMTINHQNNKKDKVNKV